MVSIIKTCRAFEWPVNFLSVISDRPCVALQKAGKLGVSTEIIDKEKLGNDLFQTELFKKIAQYAPDLIILAGFMVILSPKIFSNLFNNIVNVHPSLLPRFKGLNTHRRVLNESVSEHGATIHSLSPGVDDGPIICQAKINILSSDSEDILEKKVLTLEHFIFPLSIGAILSGKVVLEKGKWHHVEGYSSWFKEKFKSSYEHNELQYFQGRGDDEKVKK